jgi:hypothetical protein
MIWREKRVWLFILGLALAADVFVFVTYRVQFNRRIEDVESRKVQAEDRLRQAHNARLTAEQTFARYRKVQADLDSLYDTRWATLNERFIPLVKEIKRLSVATQLMPRSITYNRIDEKETPASKTKAGIGTTVVSIAYSVSGNYQQVRRLINLLELSDQFVIIDSLSVATTGDPTLVTLNLRLKTLFREPRRGTTSPTAETKPTANQVM